MGTRSSETHAHTPTLKKKLKKNYTSRLYKYRFEGEQGPAVVNVESGDFSVLQDVFGAGHQYFVGHCA